MIWANGGRISDAQSNNYIEDDGTYVSEVTFNENGIFSSIIKAVRQDGSYTVTVDQGDYHDVLQGVYEDYGTSSKLQTNAPSTSNATAAWSWTFWGEETYSVSITTLQTISTVAALAAAFAGYLGFGTAALALAVASGFFRLIAIYYSEYGSNTVYFHAYKYYGIEDVAGTGVYHHLAYTYIYSDAAHNNLITYNYDEFAALSFCW